MSKWNLPPKGQMDKSSGIYFQNMTMKELAERRKVNDVLIIPVGSTETHGPGQPLGEDTFLVTRMAEEVARVTGCTVAQPIWYGTHPYHHMGMPGTIVIPEEVFIQHLQAVIAGFWNAGFRKIILFNGHGQEWVIPNAIHRFLKQYQLPSVITMVHWWLATNKQANSKENGGPFETGLVHACEVECSYTMAVCPEMVKNEDLIDVKLGKSWVNPEHVNDAANAKENAPLYWWGQEGLKAGMYVNMHPEGSLGPSTKADPKKAEPGIVNVLNYMEKLVNDILDSFPPGKLPPANEFCTFTDDEIANVMKLPGEKGWVPIYSRSYPPTL